MEVDEGESWGGAAGAAGAAGAVGGTAAAASLARREAASQARRAEARAQELLSRGKAGRKSSASATRNREEGRVARGAGGGSKLLPGMDHGLRTSKTDLAVHRSLARHRLHPSRSRRRRQCRSV